MYFLITLLVVVMLSMIIGMMLSKQKKASPPISNILAEVKHILELNVVEEKFKSVVPFSAKDKMIGGFNRPFSERKFTVEYIGVIVCGCDLSMIHADQTPFGVKIFLPHSRVLHAYAKQDSIKVLDKSEGIFSSGIKLEDQNRGINSDLCEWQTRLIDDGILLRADERVRGLLASFFDSKSIKFELEFIDGGRPSIISPSMRNLIE